ncbi:PqqD family protein [Arthrobacter sp. SLBN-122]|uniref:PqqD family protein n=1 Tax=Arthrobacter sp. SLBN-122 TaxID=2768455 RepID=UPI001F2E053B|nr:PqqD family protein [Arthrobacter sp. SLBN-122]
MTSAGITGNEQSAWQQRLFEELARGGDLLCLKVLGQRFVVRWGHAVTWQQRVSMSLAWTRCIVSSPQPLLPPEPMEPAAGSQFTASVTCASMKYGDGTFHIGAASFEELAENLTSRLTVSAILANAGELTMLHACGVADPGTGAVVALVAKSGTGKTTAASVLARTYGYVTDETVAIAWDGSVVPYPKPLSVKQGAGAPKRQAGPDEFGLQPAPALPFIQSIVLLNRVQAPNPVAPVLERVPLADALLALIPESSSQADVVDPLQSLCRLIESVGGVWQVTYAEAADLPVALEPLFRLQPTSGPEWEAAAPDAARRRLLPAGSIRRRASRDAVKIGRDLLVMLDNEIVRLSGIGPALWEACSVPRGLEELTEHIAELHGEPEGYRATVATAVEQLIATSVLERRAH